MASSFLLRFGLFGSQKISAWPRISAEDEAEVPIVASDGTTASTAAPGLTRAGWIWCMTDHANTSFYCSGPGSLEGGVWTRQTAADPEEVVLPLPRHDHQRRCRARPAADPPLDCDGWGQPGGRGQGPWHGRQAADARPG